MTSNDNPREVVILSAVRTPMGRFRGSLSNLSATQLGAVVVKAAMERIGAEHIEHVDEVLMGNVVSAGLGQAPARQASIFAGIPHSVGATTVNKVCGSGLKTGMLAAQAIKAGDADLVIAGGMESMSNAPYLVDGRTGKLAYGHVQLTDALLLDGLWDPFEEWEMGMAAEYIGEMFDVTREEMDQWALESHQKATVAKDSGKFEEEITPVDVPGKKGKVVTVKDDETPRPDTSLEKLAALKPAFKPDGKVTAGNASGLNDGASAIVYASREKAEAFNVAPIASVVGYAQAAVPPKELFTAPSHTIPKLLQKVGWSFEDVDLIELNEAFAAQVLANGKALQDEGWEWSKVNVNGGGIALGHPIGASGARILTTMLFALKDRELKRGVASLCLGGGEAVAMAVELER